MMPSSWTVWRRENILIGWPILPSKSSSCGQKLGGEMDIFVCKIRENLIFVICVRKLCRLSACFYFNSNEF